MKITEISDAIHNALRKEKFAAAIFCWWRGSIAHRR